MSGVRPLFWIGTFGWFGAFAVAMLVATWAVLPALVAAGIDPLLAWFLVAGPVFAAMLVGSAVALRREGVALRWQAVAERLRLRPLTRADLRWIAAGFALTGLGSALLLGLGELLGFELRLVPVFFTEEPLARGQLWLLLAWLPVFVVNILGEELLWRGVLLPRQEQAFGRHGWLANAIGWLSFHICFGPSMMLFLVPMIFAQAWACQRSGNTSVGVAIHGAINGVGFVVVSLLGSP
ncbi:MAG TPA: CPBP family intramembrane glutamic endopeptidase [Enhygromyxa sp.]|nr:CPBP family intramembrane glutamic endopeptidase [Enhygromyxa sp.]